MKGWKTVIFGLLLALISVFSSADMQAFFAEHVQWLGGLTGVIVIGLRAVTSSPIFKSDE